MTRVVLVTGANRGIGRELARQLAGRGDAVILTAIDLLIPALDVAYALVWLPGRLLAATGRYWIVGPYTLAVLPLTLVVNAILYRFQRRRVFNLSLEVARSRVTHPRRPSALKTS